MQLEELQQHWQRLDEKLNRSLALETELVRQVIMQPARRRINWLAIWPAIDVAFSLSVLLVSAMFLSNQKFDWQVIVPAGVFMLGALGLLITSILQLQRLYELDWSGPVASIQSSLQRLRMAKIQQFKWIILLSPLVGFCGLMVSLHWLLNWLSEDRANFLEKIDSWWVVGNYIFGVLFVPLGYYLAGVLARKCQGHSWWQSILDDISGKSLKAATLDIERWASLQKQ